jgi:hypothetical protein
MANRSVSAKYDSDVVGGIALLEIIENPRSMTVREIALRIVADPGDCLEMNTAIRAICELRRFCLVRYGDDELIEPTQAAVRARDLLAAASLLA